MLPTAWSPWLKFKRAMFMPQSISPSNFSCDQHAGPMVQTICGGKESHRKSYVNNLSVGHASEERRSREEMRHAACDEETPTLVFLLCSSVGDKIFSRLQAKSGCENDVDNRSLDTCAYPQDASRRNLSGCWTVAGQSDTRTELKQT